ncbi:hypothetical protein Ciccas_002401 [Cichlidogyrus casuarinus]|uniref:Uncharacterized protein n=1 Tax=Cichlidogyrus casuarinus TaxID=1844966 RepID=A0ABD2QHB8_9PLAT
MPIMNSKLLETHKNSHLNEAQKANKRLSKVAQNQVLKLRRVQHQRAMDLDHTRLGTLMMLKQIGHCRISENPLVKKLEQRHMANPEQRQQPAFGGKLVAKNELTGKPNNGATVVKPKSVLIDISNSRSELVKKPSLASSRRLTMLPRKSIIGMTEFCQTVVRDLQDLHREMPLQDSNSDWQYGEAVKLTRAKYRAQLHKWCDRGECSKSPPEDDSDLDQPINAQYSDNLTCADPEIHKTAT